MKLKRFTSTGTSGCICICGNPRALTRCLKDVADNIIANVMLIDLQRNVVYHPYDGGADVILGTQAEQERWRTTYRRWLSQHPSGM